MAPPIHLKNFLKMKSYIKINPRDSVAVATCPGGLKRGETVSIDDTEITLADDIPQGHKFALKHIAPGSDVIKYGYSIGRAVSEIMPGQWIHSHNLRTALGDNETYEYRPADSQRAAAASDRLTASGYLRRDGRMGIRNELWVVPTVGCVNAQANLIAERLRSAGLPAGVDDARAFTHNYGCSQLGADHENTRRALAALATHPNAGGVIVLGLGCENNRIDALREEMGDYDADRVRFIVAQKCDDEVEEGVRLGLELLETMKLDRRQPLPLSKLRVGLKCGGSDGLSGITANPLVGRFSDWLIAHGGSTVLTEVPEMFGAETILMDRARDRAVFDKTVSLINDFKDYYRNSGMPIYENPSPGNKDGGITTLEEKSLGCVQKGGLMPVEGVICYAGRIAADGLNLLNAPGNDLVAATALALTGCQMVLFTTGRGTPFGTFVPTMKISTNTPLSVNKPKWIDFNAGALLDEPADEVLDRLVAKVLDVANGAKTKNELVAAKEIAIFKTGVTL